LSLRRRVPWLIGLTIIIILIGVGAFSQYVYRERLASLEEMQVRQSVDRALAVFNDSLAEVGRQAGKCGQDDTFLRIARSGAWDDAAAFFDSVFFSGSGTDTAVIFEPGGQPVFAQRYDPRQGGVEPSSVSLLSNLTRVYPHFSGATGGSGLVQTPEGVLLVAVQPLSAGRVDDDGILVLGRFVDAAMIQHIAATSHLNLSLSRYTAPSAAPDRTTLFPSSPDAPAVAVERVSDETIVGVTVLNDLGGMPALVLTAYLPRNLYWQGRDGLQLFIFFLLLAGLLCGLGAMLLLDRLVLKRLAGLSRSMQEIAAGNESLQVPVTGRDELSGLETGINGMLSALAQSEAVREREEKYAAVFNNANDAMFLYRLTPDEPASSLVEVNDVACRMLGQARETLMKLELMAYIVPEYAAAFRAATERLWLLGQVRFELELTGGGNRIPVEVNAHVFPLGTQRYALAIVRDISDRKEAERKLQYRLTLEQALSQAAGLLGQQETVDFNEVVAILGRAVGVGRSYIFTLNPDGNTITKTAEWCAPGVPSRWQETRSVDIRELKWVWSRLKQREAISIPDVLHLPPEAAAERRHYSGLGARAILTVPIFADGRFAGNLGFAVIDTPRRWADEDIQLLKTVSGIVASYLERKTTEGKVRYLSFHDKLTGLYNKAYFEEEIVRLDTERQLPLSLVMGDVNGLKIINDAFGHTAGDALLHAAAQVLKDVCRKEDIIARWGGDEFVILLPKTSPDAVREIIRRIRRGLETTAYEHVPLSMALGAAVKETPETDIRQVFRAAEDRMYHNKLTEGKQTRAAIIASLVKTLTDKGFQTDEHIKRTRFLAVSLGTAAGVTPDDLDRLGLLAALHDIGKISIPAEIIHKTGPLSDAEWAEVRKHPEVGFRIANSIPELVPLAEAILAHHEWWDGSGYPAGMAGREIPLIARIITLVDTYDTMVNAQPYREAMDKADALAELEAGAGRQFDPELVRLFIELLRAET